MGNLGSGQEVDTHNKLLLPGSKELPCICIETEQS